MAKPTPRADPKTVALYAKLVATVPGIELKGAALPYTAVNGNMFSMIGSSGKVALRLPAPDREAFLEKYDTELQVEYGIVRPEYVLVPPALLAKTRELAKHFARSVAYARALKTKPTTRKKKTGSSPVAKRPTRKR
jgi:hypothetical protein